ncbi:AAA family ATPase [Rahnella victoriana]|uniref:AAA family ATPase n=1 Tax=Rahnella victoriana TaxID=1510570 RepID=UPI00197DFBB0|nr:AAA family ATPase [Rahnella victoriana]
MIKKINKLRDFGIYENHENLNCDTFSKFNLIYGWNGAGKSTLTKLFRCIEKKDIANSGYPLASFEIEYEDAENIKNLNEHNIKKNPLNIFTFNSDFVKENIDWDNSINSILLIDKKKINDRNKLEKLKTEYKKLRVDLDIKSSSKENLDTEMQGFLTKAARNIKTSLKVINTQDKRYLNYNKTTLNMLINSKREVIFSNESLLKDDELGDLTRAALPIEMPVINSNIIIIDLNVFSEKYTKITNILHKSVTNNVITSLRDNPSLQNWVEQGLIIHKDNNNEECAFCGGKIQDERIKELDDHFNDAFKKFKQEILSTLQFCTPLPKLSLPPKNSFFPELQENLLELEQEIKGSEEKINILMSAWEDKLMEKSNNPFDKYLEIAPLPIDILESYNIAVSKTSELIKIHNNKSLNFKNETSKIKNRLEIHFASRELIDFEYTNKEKDRKKIDIEIDALLNKEGYLRQQIITLEESLSDESIAANVFNQELHRFLGRSEINLNFDIKKKGYRIVRNGSDKHAINLSEGEKTAIAFVYFAIKIDESNNDITQSIIVVDDPVSSFDSNHLFHSYAFLKKKFENSKQLFVLTHSFSYFKLVRDWILKKNKRDNIKSMVYIIETYIENVRKSKIINAPLNLIDYNSEYHYLYSRLKHFKERPRLELDEVYLCANLSRKLLETFLSFKFPKKRSNFKALVDDSIKNIENINQDEVEKLYRFINKYSHNQEIDMGDNTDNLLGESPAIIKYLFTIMQTIDSVHYAEMESLAV